MTSWQSWRPVYRAMCPEPGQRDLFLIVLVNGRRVGLQPVTDYERLRPVLETFAREQECHVKLLPMTSTELFAFCGIEPSEPQPMDALEPAFRAQAVQNCLDLLRASREPRECDEALDLMRKLGVLSA